MLQHLWSYNLALQILFGTGRTKQSTKYNMQQDIVSPLVWDQNPAVPALY